MTLWSNRDYRWWFAGDTAAMAAMSLRQFAVPLAAYGLSGSVALAGLVGTAQAAVATVASVPGGVLVDRHDRRATIRVFAVAGLLVWGSVTGLALAGALTFWAFFALAALGALSAGLFGHATDAALRSIVPTADYPRAMATNEGRSAAVQLASGPIGGALYAVSLWLPFATALAGYVVLFATTFGLRADLRPPAYQRSSFLRELADAARWLAARRRIWVLAPLFTAINVAVSGAMFSYQMTLLTNGSGPLAVGWLSGVLAASMLVGSLFAGPLLTRVRTGTLTAVALGWLAASLLATVATDALPVLLVCLGFGGLFLPALNAALLGFVFGKTPTELQGRVQTLLTVISGGLAAFAPGLTGVLLPLVGYRATVGGFVGLLACCAVVATFADAVRSIPTPDEWQDAAL